VHPTDVRHATGRSASADRRRDAGAYRRVGVVPAGSFEGERLSGEVRDGGSDWQTVRNDGVTALNVRLVLKTKDDVLIGMTYQGLRHGPPDVIARIEKGEVVDPRPRNTIGSIAFAVGIGHRFADGPVYSVFEVL
jgi:Protein of unknown function (DUF3237)